MSASWGEPRVGRDGQPQHNAGTLACPADSDTDFELSMLDETRKESMATLGLANTPQAPASAVGGSPSGNSCADFVANDCLRLNHAGLGLESLERLWDAGPSNPSSTRSNASKTPDELDATLRGLMGLDLDDRGHAMALDLLKFPSLSALYRASTDDNLAKLQQLVDTGELDLKSYVSKSAPVRPESRPCGDYRRRAASQSSLPERPGVGLSLSTSSIFSTPLSSPSVPSLRGHGSSREVSPRDGCKRKVHVLVQSPHCPVAMKRDSWSLEQFQLDKVVYIGDTARVVKAMDTLSRTVVAIKAYKRSGLSDMAKYQVAREIRGHSKLANDAIIGLYSAWKDKQFIYMVQEFAPNGDLMSHMQCTNQVMLDETAVVKVVRPLLRALRCVHSHGMIHRNLRPENVLLGEDCTAKLADFSFSIDHEAEVANTRLGTLDYCAPEMLRCSWKQHPLDSKSSFACGYDNKVDVWALGVLTYECLTRQLPFRSNSVQGRVERISQCEVSVPHGMKPNVAHFILLCLQKEPSARPSVDELLRHPWITGF